MKNKLLLSTRQNCTDYTYLVYPCILLLSLFFSWYFIFLFLFYNFYFYVNQDSIKDIHTSLRYLNKKHFYISLKSQEEKDNIFLCCLKSIDSLDFEVDTPTIIHIYSEIYSFEEFSFQRSSLFNSYPFYRKFYIFPKNYNYFNVISFDQKYVKLNFEAINY